MKYSRFPLVLVLLIVGTASVLSPSALAQGNDQGCSMLSSESEKQQLATN
jgi:hypothetical protein